MIIKATLSHYKKKDGTRQIKIYVYRNGKDELIPTQYYIDEKDWANGRVKNTRLNADYINADLSNKMADIERSILEGNNPVLGTKRKLAPTLYGFWEDFNKGIADGTILIEGKKSVNKGQRYSPHSVKPYVTYLRLLQELKPGLNWNGVTIEFINELRVWMYAKQYADNSIAKAVKTIASVMARGKKYHDNKDYMDFDASYHEADTIALYEDEIKLIECADLPEHLQAERERFLLSYNFFLRFGDSLAVEKKDVFQKDGRHFAKLIGNKTKSRSYVPLFPISVELLKKHNYALPKTTNQESNWKLKEIGRLAKVNKPYTQIKVNGGRIEKITKPKHDFITTHTARRSMATNLYLSMKKHGNVDLKAITLMGGWNSVEQLERYLKIDKLSNAIDLGDHPFFK